MIYIFRCQVVFDLALKLESAKIFIIKTFKFAVLYDNSHTVSACSEAIDTASLLGHIESDLVPEIGNGMIVTGYNNVIFVIFIKNTVVRVIIGKRGQ